jgi:putative oxidoreductase
VQRLFSTFPNAWPGAGLLLLRLIAGIPLIVGAAERLTVPAQAGPVAGHLAAAVAGLCLVIGLMTPMAGAADLVIQLWTMWATSGGDHVAVVAGALAACVIMLGPGAWSIDARRFGRKRINIPVR